MEEKNTNAKTPESELTGPPHISIFTFFLKILAGGTGGAIGGIILFLIFILADTALKPLTEGISGGEVGSFFLLIIMMMIFLSSTAGNILSTLLMALTESSKYKRKASAMFQIFIIGVIIFLFMIPVYFISATVDISILGYAVGLHVIIGCFISALILEIVSNYRHALVGVYGVTFAILLSAAIMFALARLFPGKPTILLFAILPIVWGCIAFMQGLVTAVYGFIAGIYDKDFLSTQTLYGEDYGKEVEAEDTGEDKKEIDEQAGSDFLRKKN